MLLWGFLSWWLLPPTRLGAAVIVERALVIVADSNHGVSEGFLRLFRTRDHERQL